MSFKFKKLNSSVVNANGENRIDDFVFYDVKTDYLASKLISI